MAPHRNNASFYGVRVGRHVGVYTSWLDCEKEVKGFHGARHQKFGTREEAEAFAYQRPLVVASSSSTSTPRPPAASLECAVSSLLAQFSNTSQPSTSSQSHISTQPAVTTLHAGLTIPMQPNDTLQMDKPTGLTSSPANSQRVSSPVDAHFIRGSSSKPQQSVTTSPDWDVVYVCGTWSKVTGVASIGVWWGPHDPRNLAERCPGKQAKKRAELLAIVRLLESTEVTEKPLLIRTDSEYFINCFKIWIKSWKENDWLDSGGQPVKRADILRYISKYLEIRSNFGQKVVVAYTRHREGKPGTEGARELVSRGASTPSVRSEPDWKEKEEILCQLNRTMVALRREIAETEVLGPNDVSDNLAIEEHATPRRAIIPPTDSGGP